MNRHSPGELQSVAAMREVLRYDPATGDFYWKIATSRAKPNQLAGCQSTAGYRKVRYKRREYLLHRLAWAFEHDKWPEEQIDHIDGNPLNNRLCNLREATPTQNLANMLRCKRNTTGMKGVCKTRFGTWEAHLRVGGKHRLLGTFADPRAAKAAFVAGHHAAFGDFSAPYYVGEPCLP